MQVWARKRAENRVRNLNRIIWATTQEIDDLAAEEMAPDRVKIAQEKRARASRERAYLLAKLAEEK